MKLASWSMSEENNQFWACFAESPEERIKLIKKLSPTQENLRVIEAIAGQDPSKKVQRFASAILQKSDLN